MIKMSSKSERKLSKKKLNFLFDILLLVWWGGASHLISSCLWKSWWRKCIKFVKMEAPGTSKNFIKLKSCTKPSDSPLGISLQDNKFFCWISNQFNARNNQKKCYKNIQTSSTNDFLLSSFIYWVAIFVSFSGPFSIEIL